MVGLFNRPIIQLISLHFRCFIANYLTNPVNLQQTIFTHFLTKSSQKEIQTSESTTFVK